MSNHEIKFTKLSISNLPKLPEMSQELQGKINKQIAQAFEVAAEKLFVAGDKPSSHVYDTSTLRSTFSAAQATLTKEKLDEIINRFFRPKSFEEQLRDAILATLKQAGLHTDNIDRVAYALDSDVGKDAMLKLKLEEIKDTETLAQKFLKIYYDIVNS
jgi:hypothetical protein